jgi:hypothetical protein
MAETTAAIAARCLEDPAFARAVLQSDDYPVVRGAIIADLEEEHDSTGYLNPQPLPPGPDRSLTWAQDSQTWGRWTTLRRSHVRRLAIGG